MTRPEIRAPLPAIAAVAMLLAGSCGERERPEPAQAEALLPAALPDISALEPSVQEQLRVQHAVVLRLQQAPGASRAELGEAHGAMGKLLMAAESPELAEPYFVNARTLAPTDPRWPYYLGHVYRTRGMLEQAVSSFEQALAVQPGDVATLVWLGELHLSAGRPDAAAPMFERVLSRDPQSLAARFGLGRAALAQKRYRDAVSHLEAALALETRAANVHYPLAMAYRGLGDSARAEAHLKQQGKFEILPPDPLLQEVRGLLQNATSYEIRGTRALTNGRWEEAAAAFREGLEVEPSNPALRHKLGTALHMLGQPDAARDAFQQVIRESPEYSKAHYSLGVLLESSGQHADAIERYAAAVRHEPGYLEARTRLAGLLRLRGRLQEALTHYDAALAIDPRAPEALFGSAMIFVRLQRYDDARARLVAGREAHSTHPGFAHALARILSAAPAANVRDGRQAMALMQGMSEKDRRLDFGETMAMALAEAGEYQQAAAWQRDAIAAARRAGNEPLAQRMAVNLRLYEAGQPSRTPWRQEDLP